MNNKNLPYYATFDPAAKFLAIQSIIARRLKEHPNAICSYSGGSDSDIVLDLIERTRELHHLPPVPYAFFNTGLEMQATKDHVRDVAKLYGVEIHTYRPKVNIVNATRLHGVPFVSKLMSAGLEGWQKKGIPLSIADEYAMAVDKIAKRQELRERYPKSEETINFLCACRANGEPREKGDQLTINASKYMLDFVKENPPDFKISAKCCKYCKKYLAHRVQKNAEMIITGERRSEGGVRTITYGANSGCYGENAAGQYKLRPLYYVSNEDKAWYKDYYGVRYSDAYEVYGFKRTGCCGCPINSKVLLDLQTLEQYEPNIVKAAWNVFGKSYEYRQRYNEYKAQRMAEDKAVAKERKNCLP